jgi:hypothetical protein
MILNWFVQRWQVEVTFEEVRAHLGVETQRQWSDKAIARTTPVLMGLFSLVIIIAHRFQTTHGVPVRSCAWYNKQQPTFSDALALVRSRLWQHRSFSMSGLTTDVVKIPAALLDQLTEALCYAAQWLKSSSGNPRNPLLPQRDQPGGIVSSPARSAHLARVRSWGIPPLAGGMGDRKRVFTLQQAGYSVGCNIATSGNASMKQGLRARQPAIGDCATNGNVCYRTIIGKCTCLCPWTLPRIAADAVAGTESVD